MMESSLFMIKPCAYNKRDEILDMIGRKLKIISVTDIIISNDI